MKVKDEKKCSPDSEFSLTASWFDENVNLQQSDDIPEKFLYPIQKVTYLFISDDSTIHTHV